MLSLRGKDGRPVLPWAQRSGKDLRLLYERVARVREVLPHPDACPEAWQAFLRDHAEEWASLVSQLFFADSVCDNQRASESAQPPVASFSCPHCSGRALGTRQALLTHVRVKHGVKNVMRMYAGRDCKCQACQT
eukprot:7437703-Pyramimonas_sp.AAC.1